MKKSIGARTIIYPTPALVVGTYDTQGRANAMTVAWAGICCSDPPCVAVSLRKATSTFHNISTQKAFTVNVPSEDFVREVDYFGIASGKDEDKFLVTGLTPVKGEFINAPYIEEFPFILECRLIHTLELGVHTQFIGEILDVKAEESLLGKNDTPDAVKVKPLIYTPEYRHYFSAGSPIGRAFSIGKTFMKPSGGG